MSIERLREAVNRVEAENEHLWPLIVLNRGTSYSVSSGSRSITLNDRQVIDFPSVGSLAAFLESHFNSARVIPTPAPAPQPVIEELGTYADEHTENLRTTPKAIARRITF